MSPAFDVTKTKSLFEGPSLSFEWVLANILCFEFHKKDAKWLSQFVFKSKTLLLFEIILFVTTAELEPTTTKFVGEHSTSLAKQLIVHLRTKWLWVRVPLQSLKFQISCLFRISCSFIFKQFQSVDSL